MRTKILLIAFALLISFGGISVKGGGGPDAYGYTWLQTGDPGGPSFTWIDIRNLSGAEQVTGLADDNSRGPFAMGWNFTYYWSQYNEVKLGFNGWIGFKNIGNIAHCFPTMPAAGGSGDNFVAPLMTDLTFAGAGNYGTMHYWSNNVDSFIVQYDSVPSWVNANPDYTGANTFQVVFSGIDNSITFNYQDMMPTFNDQPGCPADVEIGIENVTGNIGLEAINEAMPPDNHSIVFIRPTSSTFQVPDAAPIWAGNSDNKGQFVFSTTDFDVMTGISNVGNAPITSNIIIDGEIYKIDNTTLVWSDQATLPSSSPGVIDTVTFNSVGNLTDPGQYYYRVATTNGQDINPSNNSTEVEISAIQDNGGIFNLTYYTDTTNLPDGVVSWSGGGGNDGAGVYMDPPGGSVTISSLWMWLWCFDNDPNTTCPSGCTIEVLEEDANGNPGNVLATETIAADDINENFWNEIVLANPVTIADPNKGFFVSWVMGGDSVGLGTESIGPSPEQNYEILSGSWAEYRFNPAEDLAIIAVTSIFVGEDNPTASIVSLDAYPNPASDRTTIAFELVTAGDVNFTMTNMFGQTVKVKTENVAGPGKYGFDMNTSDLAGGVYFINMEVGGERLTRKLVIQ